MDEQDFSELKKIESKARKDSLNSEETQSQSDDNPGSRPASPAWDFWDSVKPARNSDLMTVMSNTMAVAEEFSFGHAFSVSIEVDGIKCTSKVIPPTTEGRAPRK